MANVGTGASGKTLIGAGNTSSPTFASIGTNSGLTAHGLVIAEGNNPFSVTTVGLSGQLMQSGGAGVDPTWTTATYPSTAGTSGNVITSNGTNFTSASLPAFPTTTLPNHSVALGTGTANLNSVGPTATIGQILQSAGSSADPAFSTATYPLTTTISQLLYSSSNNTVAGLATANSATLVTSSTGVPAWSGTMTNGQLIIGSTGATPTAASQTAGAGITITPSAGGITIAATATTFTWSTITASQTLAVNHGYFCISAGGALVLPLPAASAVGDTIEVCLDGATSWQVTQGAGQQIRLGNLQTTSGAGGSLASTAQGDSIRLVCSVANLKWNVASGPIGNITVV